MELKFKVWDKKNKEFIANGDVMDLYYSARCNAFMFDNDNYDLNGNIEFLQYTGRKVKNEQEVYEGDIGKNIDGIFLVTWSKEKSAFVIHFYNYPNETLYLEEMWDDSEIIGNMYENPELLEVNHD